MRAHRLLAVLTAAGLAAAGCSSSSSDGAAYPPTAEGLEQFARHQAQTLIDGDAAAMWEGFDKTCREKWTRPAWALQVKMALELAKAFGFDLEQATIGDVTTKEVTATEGRAAVELLLDASPTEEADFERYVYEDGSWRMTNCEALDDSDTETTTTTVDPDQPGQRANPLPIGEQASVGDYDVTVLSFTPDATDEVLAKNEYAEPPPAGSVYSLVRLKVVYRGDDEGTPGFELGVGVAGDDNRLYDDCPVTPPESLFDEPDLLPGGTAEGNMCVEVPEDQLGSGLVYVEDELNFDETKTWWRRSG